MTNNINYEWWKSLQDYNIETIIQLGDKYPDLIWSTLNDPSFLPSITNTDNINLLQHKEILGNSLENINALQWLLFNYKVDDNTKSIISYILDKAKPTDLNDRRWGSKDNTVLHLVSLLGYEDICLDILQKGGCSDIENKDGYLPIHVTQKETIIQLLQSVKQNDNASSITKTKSTRNNLKNNNNSNNSDTSSIDSSARRPNYSNPNRFQQLRQLAELSSHQSDPKLNTRSSSSSITTMNLNNNNGNTKLSTMKHKDEYYFKPGRVEQTKQKVLTDEEKELQKHREHRRKDIDLLAKRSAVKNNPFIKNASDSRIKSTKQRRQKSISPSISSATNPLDRDGSNKIEHSSYDNENNEIKEKEEEEEEKDEEVQEVNIEDEDDINTKPKRNSKVINSLQTKSYVTSSIFLQTESSSTLSKKKKSKASLNKTSSQTKDDTTTINDKLEMTDPLFTTITTISPSSSSPTPLTSPALDRTSSSESTASTQSSSTNTNIINNSIIIPIVNDHHHHDEELSSKIEISSIDIPLQDKKSFDIKNDNNNNDLSSSPIAYNNNDNEEFFFKEKKKQQSAPLPVTITINNTMPSVGSGSDLDQKRLGGCQKSNWEEELETWSSSVDKKININKSQSNGIDNDIKSLSIRENNHHQQQQNYFESNKYQYEDHDHITISNHSLPSPSSISSISSSTYHSENRQDNNKSYGNISLTTSSRYIRRLPTYDQIPYTNTTSTTTHSALDDKKNKNIIDIKKENNHNHNYNHSNNNNTTSVTSTLPNLSQHQPKPHYPLVRSASAFESIPSLSSYMNSSPFFSSSSPNKKSPHSDLLKNHSLKNTSALSNNNDHDYQLIQNSIGKLYVRVHSVTDVLLPIPTKEKVYVRCVINDGKYEYISSYEVLAQQMTFGYECIIDCKPDMIITLSLHVRADYLLKRPLTKLLTTVQRKRKGSLSAFVSSEDGSVGQTRFAVKDMLHACYRRSFASQFHCFNAWYIPTSFLPSSSSASSLSPYHLPFTSTFIHKKKSSSSSSMNNHDDDDDHSVLKVIGNFDVELLYLPVSDFSSVVPKNLRECDMAIKLQQWNETCLDTEFVPKKIHRPQPQYRIS